MKTMYSIILLLGSLLLAMPALAYNGANIGGGMQESVFGDTYAAYPAEPAAVYTPSAAPVGYGFRSTSAFSGQYFSGQYTIPFAASELSSVGSTSPRRDVRKKPPGIGGDEVIPDTPGYRDPIGDGLWVLLFCAAVYAVVTALCHKKNRTIENIE